MLAPEVGTRPASIRFLSDSFESRESENKKQKTKTQRGEMNVLMDSTSNFESRCGALSLIQVAFENKTPVRRSEAEPTPAVVRKVKSRFKYEQPTPLCKSTVEISRKIDEMISS